MRDLKPENRPEGVLIILPGAMPLIIGIENL